MACSEGVNGCTAGHGRPKDERQATPGLWKFDENLDQFSADVYGQAMRLGDLLYRKHLDYGPDNIGRAPGGALNGIVVRLHDKMSRLAHLSETGKAPNNESIRDTYMDIANYALIALMVLDGQWPGMETDRG